MRGVRISSALTSERNQGVIWRWVEWREELLLLQTFILSCRFHMSTKNISEKLLLNVLGRVCEGNRLALLSSISLPSL